MFAQNVSTLMKAKQLATGENMRQFSERVGVPYGWLRRISTAGIQQESSRTLVNLKKLADELGFSDHRRLWEQLPERPDMNEVAVMLKARHLVEWCLVVAFFGTQYEKPEECVADIIEEAIREQLAPAFSSPGLFADFLAKFISSELAVVERKKTSI